MSRALRVACVVLFVLSIVAVVLCLPPIAQDAAYHDFGDKRPFFGIANFFDVASNLLFIVFGAMGLCYVLPKKQAAEKWLWATFFVGAILVGVGSGYYHLNPNNATLVWDRIPMTISFMSFFALIIMQYINARLGSILAPLLLLLGVGSVWYWNYTESLGQGDLRPYILVQFLPLLLIPCIIWLSPTRSRSVKYLWFTLGWYAAAKVFEHYDKEFYALTGYMVSGHSIKHLAAAMGVYTMLLYAREK